QPSDDPGTFWRQQACCESMLSLKRSRLRVTHQILGTRGNAMARTTHRSSTGTKLYAVRDAEGQFKDIQTYKRAHGADIKRTSAPEKAAKKAMKKAAPKKAAPKKAAKKKAAKKK